MFVPAESYRYHRILVLLFRLDICIDWVTDNSWLVLRVCFCEERCELLMTGEADISCNGTHDDNDDDIS